MCDHCSSSTPINRYFLTADCIAINVNDLVHVNSVSLFNIDRVLFTKDGQLTKTHERQSTKVIFDISK